MRVTPIRSGSLLAEAVADPLPEAQENNLTRIFPVMGETGATAEVIALVEAQ